MKRVFQLLIGILITPAFLGATVWTWHDSSYVRGTIEHDGWIYRLKYDIPKFNISRSDDGMNWEGVDPFDNGQAVFTQAAFGISEDKEILYTFVVTSEVGKGYTARIFRFTDDLGWQEIYTDGSYSDERNFPSFSGSLSFGGHLYVARIDGTILRTTEKNPVQWDTLTMFQLNGNETSPEGGDIQFARFNGSLVAAISWVEWNNSKLRWTKIFQSSDGINWGTDPIGTFKWELGIEIVDMYARTVGTLITHGNKLYYAKNELWVTEGDETNFEWTQIEEFQLYPVIPAVIFDQLHVWSLDRPVMALTGEGNWISASKISSHIKGNRENWFCDPAIIGNKAYFAPGGQMWMLEKGVTGVVPQSLPSDELFSGQEGGVALAMTIQANIGDWVQMNVKNFGSAFPRRDIKHVYLVRSFEGPGQTTVRKTLAELTPDPTNPTIWVMSSPEAVEDGDDLFITVDLAPHPYPAANIIFSVDPRDIHFSDNASFSLSGPLVGTPVEIKQAALAPGAGSIPDAWVYPQPAQNEVNFQYDLADSSRVEIKIFTRAGTLMSELRESHPAGRITSTWDASQTPAGTYYATITIHPTSGSPRTTQKMIFIDR